MTLSETRKLGIEFERRVQTMIPEKEYLDKLDTETIYAYLNSYQDKYIHDIYRNLDQIKSGSKMSAHVESVLQEMLRTQTITINEAKDYTGDISDSNGIVIVENGRSVCYPLDPSFYMYVRSVSNVTSTYSFKSNEGGLNKQLPIRIVPNELVSQSDIWRLLETPHNSLRILRYPAASIGDYQKFPQLFSISEETVTYKFSDIDVEYLTDGILNDEAFISLETDLNIGENNKYSKQEILTLIQDNKADEIAIDVEQSIANVEDGETIKLIYIVDRSKFNEDLSHYDSETHMMFGRYPMAKVTLHIYNIKITKGFVPTLNVIYDLYTTPLGIKIVYYAQPQRFDIMTSTRCELPMDAFDDLVTGAVDLYVQYVAGAEANKRRLQEAANRQAKEAEKQRKNKDDED